MERLQHFHPLPPKHALPQKKEANSNFFRSAVSRHDNTVQTMLSINEPGDEYEREADAVADQVMRMTDEPAIQRKGDHGKEAGESTLQRKESGNSAPPVSSSVKQTLQSSGQPLDDSTRASMEQSFGYDFSDVRVHNNSLAHQSAQDIQARAYTFQNHVVFNDGQYQPQTSSGKRLLAHELVHVQQQGSGTIRRCADPAKNDPRFDAEAKWTKTMPAYTALDPSDKTLVDTIITESKKKAGCLYYIGKLQDVFATKVKSAATISTETKASTANETTKEQTRVAKPAEAKNVNIEKTAADDPARKWTPIVGKFGGGTYEVDKTDSKNIVVRAKIFLQTKGTGAQTDIDGIKAMHDGIEKAASTKGYIVSIEFVNDTSDPKTFTVDVDPSKWETATNWSGGEPLGFAHELHHMFAFELDRYDYIVAHSKNESMEVSDRLHWFAEELKKPAGFNNPTSIMNNAAHPNDDDVCRVAGLDLATCMAERQKIKKP